MTSGGGMRTKHDAPIARDLRRLDKLRAVVEAAIDVHDGRYSIKTTLDRDDRKLFDRLNMAVDAWLYENATPSEREGGGGK